MARTRSYTDEQFTKAVAESFSWRQVAFNIGLNGDAGSNTTTLKRLADDLSLDISHFRGMGWNIGGTPANKRPLEELLRDGVLVRALALKKRLVAEGVLLDECNKCKLSKTWQGEPIVLELDHINGDRFDNRIENIRLLCPNCHSQTENFRGRGSDRKQPPNKFCIDCGVPISRQSFGLCRSCKVKAGIKIKEQRKCLTCNDIFTPKDNNQKYCSKICFGLSSRLVERPTPEQLKSEIESMSMVAIGKKYRVSDNAVRKWAKTFGLIE